MPLAVLNPGGRDPVQLFAQGAGSPTDPGHAPVNYHAYAACQSGGFYQREKDIPANTRAVLVLLRRKGLDAALDAVRSLRRRGAIVAISWKESGLHQIADILSDGRRVVRFREICREAGRFLSSTADLVPLYREAGCGRGGFVPTPYPVDAPAWDFSKPVGERKGIFIGTREFDVPSRNHLLAVMAAASLGVPVTVLNPDGAAEEKLLRAAGPNLTIQRGRLGYAEYLRLIAAHRFVFQFDASAVPGQVAGDALLARVPCVGGNGAIERIGFPDLTSHGRSLDEITALAARLLSDDAFYRSQIDLSQRLAGEKLSFSAVSQRLEKEIFDDSTE